MRTSRQIIASAMDEERMMYESDEANADQIIAALTSAGSIIIEKEKFNSAYAEAARAFGKYIDEHDGPDKMWTQIMAWDAAMVALGAFRKTLEKT